MAQPRAVIVLTVFPNALRAGDRSERKERDGITSSPQTFMNYLHLTSLFETNSNNFLKPEWSSIERPIVVGAFVSPATVTHVLSFLVNEASDLDDGVYRILERLKAALDQNCLKTTCYRVLVVSCSAGVSGFSLRFLDAPFVRL